MWFYLIDDDDDSKVISFCCNWFTNSIDINSRNAEHWNWLLIVIQACHLDVNVINPSISIIPCAGFNLVDIINNFFYYFVYFIRVFW